MCVPVLLEAGRECWFPGTEVTGQLWATHYRYWELSSHQPSPGPWTSQMLAVVDCRSRLQTFWQLLPQNEVSVSEQLLLLFCKSLWYPQLSGFTPYVVMYQTGQTASDLDDASCRSVECLSTRDTGKDKYMWESLCSMAPESPRLKHILTIPL